MKRDKALLLLQKQRKILTDQYRVKTLSIFGSVARDEAELDSDIDLLVEFDQQVGLFHFIELKQHLEAVLGCKVDLGTIRSLKPEIKQKVNDFSIFIQFLEISGDEVPSSHKKESRGK